MDNVLKLGLTDCWPWLGVPEEAPNRAARMACRNSMCCNPRHVVTVDKLIEDVDESAMETGAPEILESPKRGRPPKAK